MISNINLFYRWFVVLVVLLLLVVVVVVVVVLVFFVVLFPFYSLTQNGIVRAVMQRPHL